MKDPATITTMAELREQIDALDGELVVALAARARFIDRAAQLKQGEHLPARISWRVEDVVEKVVARARAEGLDPALAERIWRDLIEVAIAREESLLGPDAPPAI